MITDAQKEQLKAAGYSDADIADFEQEHKAGTTGNAINGGPAMAEEKVPDYVGPNYGQQHGQENKMANAAEGLNVVNDFLGSHIGHLLEGAAASGTAATLANKYINAIKGAQAAQAAAPTPSPSAPPTNAVAPSEYTGRPGFGFTPPPQQPPSGPQAMARPVAPGATPQMGSATPAQGVPRPAVPTGAPTAPVAQQAAPTAENFLSRMTQMAKQYAPAATEYAGSVGKVVAPIARVLSSAPVLGAQLMAHSGELNTNEDRFLAEKHALEQRMLQNKHDAEWNKYVDAKIKGLGQ
jgi:hypothetical protein